MSPGPRIHIVGPAATGSDAADSAQDGRGCACGPVPRPPSTVPVCSSTTPTTVSTGVTSASSAIRPPPESCHGPGRRPSTSWNSSIPDSR